MFDRTRSSKALKKYVLPKARWLIPVSCLVYGICVYLFPSNRLAVFNDGIAIELAGFAITILFFEFVVLQQYEAQRERGSEIANNQKIQSILKHDSNAIKRSLQFSLTDTLKTDPKEIKWLQWDSQPSQEAYANALTVNSSFHVQRRDSQQRSYHGVLDAYETAHQHVSVFLPTVKTYTEQGERFEDKLVEAYKLDSGIWKSHYAIVNHLRWLPDTNDWIKEKRVPPKSVIHKEISNLVAKIQEFIRILDSLEDFLPSE